MKTIPLRLLRLAATACALHAGAAAAITLEQAYDAALQNDPTYRANFYSNEAGKENRIIGRASLLPALSGSYTANRNRADQQQLRADGSKTPETHPRYISRSGVVQLRQPLINFEGVARYRQGVAQTSQSASQFKADTAEVALRVLTAYSDALFADDQLALAKVQRDMYREQHAVNARMFEKGEGTKTDMLETQARLDLAEAQVLEAQDNVATTRATLEGIIGMPAGTLQTLAPNFRIAPLAPASLDEWKQRALADNPALEAFRFAVEAARLEISKQRAGHLPRLDFVASYSKGDSESLNLYGYETTNRSLGLQLNVPLYAGGAVSATTRQASATYERARAELEARTNEIMVELGRAHSQVQSSVRKVDALVKATESSKELMKATEQSIKGGVRINLDLLNAQQQLFTSQRDLAQARYAYLLALLRLRAAAGSLSRADVIEVAGYFR